MLVTPLYSTTENKVSNARHTLRHRRNKSYHGTVRLGAGNALEQISRTLNDGEEFEPGEELEGMIRGMTTTLAGKREIRYCVTDVHTRCSSAMG